MSKNQAWLRLTQEEALEPELTICDPHHHLWEYPSNRYLLEEYLEDTDSGHNIVSSVFVECLSGYLTNQTKALAPTGETKFVHELAVKNKGENTHNKKEEYKIERLTKGINYNKLFAVVEGNKEEEN